MVLRGGLGGCRCDIVWARFRGRNPGAVVDSALSRFFAPPPLHAKTARTGDPGSLRMTPHFFCSIFSSSVLVLALSAPACAQSADATIARADQLIGENRLGDAEAVLDALLKKEPDNAAALNDLGLVRVKQQKTFEAQELFEKAAAADPRFLAARVNLGEAQMTQQLYDDALKSFEAALAIDARNDAAQGGEVRAAVQAALAARRAGDMDGALVYLVRARKLVPDNAELLLDFGVQAEAMRIYKDADEALTRAHGLDPANEKILYALARVELDEQKMPEAEANFGAYLKARPEDASAHYGLGHLLHMEVKDDEAKAELQRSIALQPRQTEAYYELGEIALALREDDEAKADYAKVLASDPHHGGALTGMGILAYRAKDYAGAEKYLQQAVLNAADYPTAHRYYAMLLERLGRQAEADRESELAKQLTEQQNQLSHGYALRAPQ
jgi:tetratricopeptide (TPR) repeat protein